MIQTSMKVSCGDEHPEPPNGGTGDFNQNRAMQKIDEFVKNHHEIGELMVYR